MKSIGGYFPLETSSNSQVKKWLRMYKLNSCRNALVLLIKAREYKHIYIPYYTCEVIKDVLATNNINFDYYSIDENLEIKNPNSFYVSPILYTNYFGIKDEYIKKIAPHFEKLIIDNAQAFFTNTFESCDSIYSPRKFFGLPDGGLLSTRLNIDVDSLCYDQSSDRCSHLLKRLEFPAEHGYEDFIENDRKLNALPIRKMSYLTESLFGNINISKAKARRSDNFHIIHNKLESINELRIDISASITPLCYPLLLNNGHLIKSELIKNRIFVPTYWPNISNQCQEHSFERYLINNLVCLPIDQRYGNKEMKIILNLLCKWF
jgi:hypothetical protein